MADRPADVRFYIDADTLGLARILVQLRSDVTFPGDPGGTVKRRVRPPCPISRTDTKDVDWIGPVAEQGWVIISRDRSIARRSHERAAIEAAGAKLIAISSSEQLDNWGLLEIVLSQWRWIEARTEESGPFIFSLTRTGHQRLL